MDADDFRTRVEDERQTELDRLGSSKRLVALTDATLDDETVLRTAAASEAAAAELFAEWAADATGDAAATFESFAERERDHYDRVTAELDDGDAEAAPGAVHDYLRGLDTTVERAGGVVGRGLVAERTLTQFVGYFVNQADEPRADLFRDLKAETNEDTEAAVELLAEEAADGDWEHALEAATGAIDAAYEEYVDALESMGVNAKSVC